MVVAPLCRQHASHTLASWACGPKPHMRGYSATGPHTYTDLYYESERIQFLVHILFSCALDSKPAVPPSQSCGCAVKPQPGAPAPATARLSAPFIAFRRTSTVFHCLSLTFHCLSFTFHCLFHCLSIGHLSTPSTQRRRRRAILPAAQGPAGCHHRRCWWRRRAGGGGLHAHAAVRLPGTGGWNGLL